MIFVILKLLLRSLSHLVLGQMILRPDRHSSHGRFRGEGIAAGSLRLLRWLLAKIGEELGVESWPFVRWQDYALVTLSLVADCFILVVLFSSYDFTATIFAIVLSYGMLAAMRRDFRFDPYSVHPISNQRTIERRFHRAARKLRSDEASFENRKTSIDEAVCGVCSEKFNDSDEIAFCEKCESPHHVDCWEYFEKCSVYGCKGKQANVLETEEKEVRFLDV